MKKEERVREWRVKGNERQKYKDKRYNIKDLLKTIKI